MDTLLDALKNETGYMVALIDLLKKEQSFLVQAPSPDVIEDINRVTEEKNALIQVLIESGENRRATLIALGFDPVEALAASWIQSTEQLKHWNQLIEATQAAKTLNHTNGLLVAKHLTRNQSLLDILRKNHDTQSDLSLYGADGQPDAARSHVRGVVA